MNSTHTDEHDEITSTTSTVAEPDELSPQELEKLKALAIAKGHKLLGIFSDDPGALEVFDEIERQRDLHTIGD
jgi:hypothetical protein